VVIKEVLDPEKVFVIHNFLSKEECAALIRRSEALAYEPSTVAGVISEDVRNNERVIVDDEYLASDLFQRAESFLPAVLEDHRLVGFNERWRFYRYQPGQTFNPHRDGQYLRTETWDKSELTFMIYLNDGMAGGETRFYAGIEQAFRPPRCPYLSVQPKAGAALVFVHSVWHEGAAVQSGQKYVLRTDVMYGSHSNASHHS
jgi:prolyl 4-hydroxylase